MVEHAVSQLFIPFGVMVVIATLGWVLSLVLDDVSIVDSLWSLFFLAAIVSIIPLYPLSVFQYIFCGILFIWALRLSGHLTYRNWGKAEDHRYQTIRDNNQPGFQIKSLFIIFYLQAVLAFVIVVPALMIIVTEYNPTWLGVVGMVVMTFGIIFEAIADWQLLHFLNNSTKSGVLKSGLWRYSRHPNYFGEVCVWWGVYILAADAGHAWTIFSPILLTFLILKISGVALTEKTIRERRPEYQEYMRQTNAFIPLPPSVSRREYK